MEMLIILAFSVSAVLHIANFSITLSIVRNLRKEGRDPVHFQSAATMTAASINSHAVYPQKRKPVTMDDSRAYQLEREEISKRPPTF